MRMQKRQLVVIIKHNYACLCWDVNVLLVNLSKKPNLSRKKRIKVSKYGYISLSYARKFHSTTSKHSLLDMCCVHIVFMHLAMSIFGGGLVENVY